MGYDVRIMKSTCVIPARNITRAYDRLKGMRNKYEAPREDFHRLEEILKWLAFSIARAPNHDLHITGYDNKMRDEDEYFRAIGDLCKGYITWVGEDGEHWKWTFKGKFDIMDGHIIYRRRK